LWTFLGNSIYSFSQWVILALLAKLGSPEFVGRYSLALAIVSPIILLTNLQLRGVQATDAKDLYKFGDYFGVRVCTSTIAFLIVVIVSLPFHKNEELFVVVLIVFFLKFVESISDVAHGLLQKNERMDKISISLILKGCFSATSFGLLFWLTKNLIMSLLIIVIIFIIIILFYDFKNVRLITDVKPKFEIKTIIKIAKLSLPLGIVLMLGSLNTNIPRYFIEFYNNEETLGFFSALAYLIVAGNTVINALGQSATPKLAKYYSEGNIIIFRMLVNRLMLTGLFVGFLGVIISYFFGEELLALLYRKEYASYNDVLILNMIAATITYAGSFLGYALTAARAFMIQPIFGIVWVVFTTGFSYLLIPGMGIMGASYVLILSSIVQFITKFLALYYMLYWKKG